MDARVMAECSISPSYSGEVEALALLPGGYALLVHRGAPLPSRALSGCGFVVQVTHTLLEGDVERDELGGLVYSLLLLEPIRVVQGDSSVLDRAREKLYRRLVAEESWRLYRLLGYAWSHVLIAPHYPLAARMARIARLYPWMRQAYTIVLSTREFYSESRARIVKALLDTGWYRAEKGFLAATAPPEKPRRAWRGEVLRGITEVASLRLGLDVAQLVAYSQTVLAGIRAKPHPLLKDPLLLARLRGARIATKLLGLEKQLLLITGVLPRAGRISRKSPEEGMLDTVIRSARIVSASGLPAGVVKDYRGPAAAKWLLASMLTLYLPKPFTNARRRLFNEYVYSMVLAGEGFHTHEPLLLDPRRLRAAYRYVEGKSLASIIQRDPSSRTYHRLGGLLARVHSKGYSLWDTNPSNFIHSPSGELYMVDLEQARRLSGIDEAAWDLAMAVYYSAIYSPRGLQERAALLGEGYLDSGGDKRVVLEASKLRYSLPFLAVVPVNLALKVRKTFAQLAGHTA